MLDKLKSLQVRVSITGKYYFTWQVGIGGDRLSVRRKRFEIAYQISSWYSDDSINRIKSADANTQGVTPIALLLIRVASTMVVLRLFASTLVFH